MAKGTRHIGSAERLRQYWEHGKGALKIRWGTPGDYNRCVRLLTPHLGHGAHGYCQLRHIAATGMTTSEHAKLERRK